MPCDHHHHCAKEAWQFAEDLCAQKGYRFTDSRRQVFDVLISSHKALTAKEVMKKINNGQPPITYRALEFLTQVGLAHHIASINAYVGCAHHHQEGHVAEFLICTNCHEVEEVDLSSQLSALMVHAKASNFKPQETYVEMTGLCGTWQDS